jgi:hypothetical protein
VKFIAVENQQVAKSENKLIKKSIETTDFFQPKFFF